MASMCALKATVRPPTVAARRVLSGVGGPGGHVLHIRWIAVLVVASALSLPGAVFANHNMTSLVSTGPAGGTGPNPANLPLPANFDGASADGSRVFFDSSANLVSLATDTFPDIYERAGGDTTLLSIGPVGGNGDFFATFRGASKDGTRSSTRP